MPRSLQPSHGITTAVAEYPETSVARPYRSGPQIQTQANLPPSGAKTFKLFKRSSFRPQVSPAANSPKHQPYQFYDGLLLSDDRKSSKRVTSNPPRSELKSTSGEPRGQLSRYTRPNSISVTDAKNSPWPQMPAVHTVGGRSSPQLVQSATPRPMSAALVGTTTQELVASPVVERAAPPSGLNQVHSRGTQLRVVGPDGLYPTYSNTPPPPNQSNLTSGPTGPGQQSQPSAHATRRPVSHSPPTAAPIPESLLPGRKQRRLSKLKLHIPDDPRKSQHIQELPPSQAPEPRPRNTRPDPPLLDRDAELALSEQIEAYTSIFKHFADLKDIDTPTAVISPITYDRYSVAPLRVSKATGQSRHVSMPVLDRQTATGYKAYVPPQVTSPDAVQPYRPKQLSRKPVGTAEAHEPQASQSAFLPPANQTKTSEEPLKLQNHARLHPSQQQQHRPFSMVSTPTSISAPTLTSKEPPKRRRQKASMADISALVTQLLRSTGYEEFAHGPYSAVEPDSPQACGTDRDRWSQYYGAAPRSSRFREVMLQGY